MHNLKLLIKDIEKEWLDALFNHCRKQFGKAKLASHDHLHHLRTWLIAKELFLELEKNNVKITKNDLERVIIAIFFHDIGMVKTIEKVHGTIGKKMCKDFFNKNNLKKVDGFEEVLEAIQRHDDKEYKLLRAKSRSIPLAPLEISFLTGQAEKFVSRSHPPDVTSGSIPAQNKFVMCQKAISQKSVLSVLCVSDDLEAFGAIGVFRYAEIYLLRNISIKELARKVLENLESRYKNFHSLYSNLEAFVKKQKERYNFTRGFYRDLEKELNNAKYSKTILFGAMGVLNILVADIIEGKTSISDISEKALKKSDGCYIIRFFKQFKKEVEKAHPSDF